MAAGWIGGLAKTLPMAFDTNLTGCTTPVDLCPDAREAASTNIWTPRDPWRFLCSGENQRGFAFLKVVLGSHYHGRRNAHTLEVYEDQASQRFSDDDHGNKI